VKDVPASTDEQVKKQGYLDVELIAGITTFLAMAYIMFANPAILQKIPAGSGHHIGG
jgi:xanthine/uracil/vitamin C permease (AzgA family)